MLNCILRASQPALLPAGTGPAPQNQQCREGRAAEGGLSHRRHLLLVPILQPFMSHPAMDPPAFRSPLRGLGVPKIWGTRCECGRLCASLVGLSASGWGAPIPMRGSSAPAGLPPCVTRGVTGVTVAVAAGSCHACCPHHFAGREVNPPGSRTRSRATQPFPPAGLYLVPHLHRGKPAHLGRASQILGGAADDCHTPGKGKSRQTIVF